MLLQNLHIIGDNSIKDIEVDGDKIKDIYSTGTISKQATEVYFENAIAFPGLINSHDHLDFNLFSPLRNRLYNNYAEWGNDIHTRNRETIESILKIPLELRVLWGMYKNLINGFTTVVNHGEKLSIPGNLLNVYQDAESLHSVQGEKIWKWKLNDPFKKNMQVTMHIGEGTDAASYEEISELISWNFRKRSLIGIHGVAMDKKQASFFKALVWCPASNLFTLGKTARIDRLKSHTKILFGTDSTLTSGWNLWEHIRLAREQQFTTDEELFDMLTTNPCEIFGLNNKGKLSKGYDADIVVARSTAGNPMDAFYTLNPEDILLVMHKGEIRLFDAELFNQLEQELNMKDYAKIYLNSSGKYVQGDIPALIKQIKMHQPEISLLVSFDEN